ncbi:hypothetical protein CNY89_28395, partial [Amaricoccus sp. HAR-UPW-R2A-40]
LNAFSDAFAYGGQSRVLTDGCYLIRHDDAYPLWPAAAAEIEMWRLDCGRINVPDLNAFSDAFAYGGQSRVLTDGCYLIRHDDAYPLW